MGNKSSKYSKPDSIGIDYAAQRSKGYSKSDIYLVPGSARSFISGQEREEQRRQEELRRAEEERKRVQEERERRRRMEELREELKRAEEKAKENRPVATVYPYRRL